MISVCMASYNGDRYIKEQLDSILPQLGKNDELIVSDDGSRDQTVQVVEEYRKKDSRIRLLEGPQKGVIANFEQAVQASLGDIIFLADQDDVWLPGKVAKTVDYFTEHQEIALVVSDLIIVDAQLSIVADSYFAYRNVQLGFIHNIIKNKYIGAGMAFKKEMKERILPIPKQVPMHDMWFGLIADYDKKSALLTEPLTLYRRHGDNASELTSKASFYQQLSWRWSLVRALLGKRKQ